MVKASGVNTCGLIYIHSTPSALRPHIEWAISGVLGLPVKLDWRPQPACPGHYRAEYGWSDQIGTSAKLASCLAGWQQLRFEVTEHHSATANGARYSYTPTLGIFSAITGANGDILVDENRIQQVIQANSSNAKSIQFELEKLLGKPWDDEMEVFRHASEDAPIRWLHAVG